MSAIDVTRSILNLAEGNRTLVEIERHGLTVSVKTGVGEVTLRARNGRRIHLDVAQLAFLVEVLPELAELSRGSEA